MKLGEETKARKQLETKVEEADGLNKKTKKNARDRRKNVGEANPIKSDVLDDELMSEAISHFQYNTVHKEIFRPQLSPKIQR